MDCVLCGVANTAVIPEVLLWIKSVRMFIGNVLICMAGDEGVCNALKSVPGVDCILLQKFDIHKVGWEKAKIISHGLKMAKVAFYNDIDIIYLNNYNIRELINEDVKLAPHYTKKDIEQQYGKYNSGYVSTINPGFPNWWSNELTTKPHLYGDQKHLDLAEVVFKSSSFSEQHDFAWWREWVPGFNYNELTVKDGSILWKNSPLISVHTHLLKVSDPNLLNVSWCQKFNKIILDQMNKSDKYKELLEMIKNPNI